MTQSAGWYADPSGLPAQRWWDGRQWTDHVQPGGSPMPPPNGYFPPVPPSGPAAPGPHTVPPDDPEQVPLYATQPAARSQHSGPHALPENRPAAPPAHPEAPAVAYSMPPVDAVARQPDHSIAVAPASGGEEVAGWRRVAGPVALALIAALVLALVAIILIGPGAF
ncbi:DUF2510 domain-containing protein [Actinoplanes sp. NPDC023801]|uniref:DUF2510 domain-containing protein n=1 Tax=Actinoplanes sp. NPDC023801 TaxID=3154595 RepID=UPI003402A24F